MRYKLLALMMLALGLCVAARTPDLAKVGETVDARIESPHPVSGFWRQDVDMPGATFLKLHLADMHLGDGDLLLITDAYGQEVYSQTGPMTQEGWLPRWTAITSRSRSGPSRVPRRGDSPWTRWPMALPRPAPNRSVAWTTA